MSTCTHESMTNHHVPGFLNQLSDTFHLWRHRYQDRRELALAWGLVLIFQPLTAAYYPVSVMPPVLSPSKAGAWQSPR